MLTPISPTDLAARLTAGTMTLVDVREPDERAREHIAGSMSMPLSDLDRTGLNLQPGTPVAFHCRSGMRTNQNCDHLAAHVTGDAYVLAGGLDGWKQSGLGVETNAKAPLELQRQVQLTIGLMILTGMALGLLVHPGFLIIPAFMGAGLTFAGASGWCGLALLLAQAPWNRQARTA
jgi:rhodanese-related sulfurtransferase